MFCYGHWSDTNNTLRAAQFANDKIIVYNYLAGNLTGAATPPLSRHGGVERGLMIYAAGATLVEYATELSMRDNAATNWSRTPSQWAQAAMNATYLRIAVQIYSRWSRRCAAIRPPPCPNNCPSRHRLINYRHGRFKHIHFGGQWGQSSAKGVQLPGKICRSYVHTCIFGHKTNM